MRIPAGTVASSETAPMIPTIAAANAELAPRDSAPRTRTGMIAPNPAAKSSDGTSTGHRMGLSTSSVYGRPDPGVGESVLRS